MNQRLKVVLAKMHTTRKKEHMFPSSTDLKRLSLTYTIKLKKKTSSSYKDRELPKTTQDGMMYV